MLIQFKRSRLRKILKALNTGRDIPSEEVGKPWEDSELMAVAGVCLAEMMFRRELDQRDTTDEPLLIHLSKPVSRLSRRLEAALNYVVTTASTITNGSNGCDVKGDKTFRVEVAYKGPEFECVKAPKAKPDDGPPAPDGSPPQGEIPAPGNAVMQAA